MEIRPIDLSPEGLIEVEDVLRAAFPGLPLRDRVQLRWSYLDNPSGQAVGFNAYDEARAVAHYVTQPLLARAFGERERGVLSLHTATHPDYQGRGLFTRLAEATYAAAAEAGYGFVVGVANAASTPGFLRKLGFQLVAPLDVRVGIGASPHGRGKVAADLESQIDFERVWDEKSLEWRTSWPTRTYTVRDTGAMSILYAPAARFGVQAELGAWRRGRLPAALPRERGLHPLRLWIGLDPGRAWRRSTYVTVPQRFRPSPLNFIFRDLTGRGRRLDPDRMLFRGADFDAY